MIHDKGAHGSWHAKRYQGTHDIVRRASTKCRVPILDGNTMEFLFGRNEKTYSYYYRIFLEKIESDVIEMARNFKQKLNFFRLEKKWIIIRGEKIAYENRIQIFI